MFNRIRELSKKKLIGVDLFNGRVTAFELGGDTFINKSIEEVCVNAGENQTDKSFWYNTGYLEKIFTYIQQNTKKSISMPKLFVAVPPELYKNPEHTKRITDSAIKSEWRSVSLINSFLCSADGCGANTKENKKKIFVYCHINSIYIGLIFAGGYFNFKVIDKGYDALLTEDLKIIIEEFISELKPDLPERFKKARLSKKDLQSITLSWNLALDEKIYISVPSEFEKKFGTSIGEFQLVYADSRICIIDGLKAVIPLIK